MSSDAMTLTREVMAFLSLSGGCMISSSTPSHAEAHPKHLLVGLDVDVARAPLDGVGQERVDQADDRRFLGGALELLEVDLLLALDELDVLARRTR